MAGLLRGPAWNPARNDGLWVGNRARHDVFAGRPQTPLARTERGLLQRLIAAVGEAREEAVRVHGELLGQEDRDELLRRVDADVGRGRAGPAVLPHGPQLSEPPRSTRTSTPRPKPIAGL